MTDEIKIQPEELVEQKETVNSVENKPNVNNVSTVSEGGVKQERPTFLSVLCILTFIGSGLSVLGYLFAVALSGVLDSLMGSLPFPVVPDVGVVSGIFGLVAAGASLYGAIKMWNLQKVGFYLYTAGQIVMLVLGFGVFGFIFTAIFVVLYGLNLKYLK